MARSIQARTLDGTSIPRFMIVGLSAEQEAACRKAVVPVELVVFGNVTDACKAMSTVLPLVVAVDEGMSEADRAALSELAGACGADLFDVEAAPAGREFTFRVLDAIGQAERRRFKAP